MNSSDWEQRDSPRISHKDWWDESIQTIHRMNQPGLGPVTHIIEIGLCSFPYRSAEEAARAKLAFEKQGHTVNLIKV